MMPPPDTNPPSPERLRLLRRLAVICDLTYSEEIRIAAARAVQKMLPPQNPLRYQTPEELVEECKPTWGMRTKLVAGRNIECRVNRPPQGLKDVW